MTSGMMAADPDIPREDPDLDADELTVLGQYLDFHRATLAMKCARLSDADLKRRAVPTSSLTLLGLVRHLTEVEYGWFCEWLDGQPEKSVYFTDDDPNGDFDNLDTHPVADVWTAYSAQVEESQRILAPSPTAASRPAGCPADPAGRATSAGSSPTWWRSMPGTTATPTCSGRPSTARPASSLPVDSPGGGPMIVEYIRYTIEPGRADAFLQAYTAAASILQADPRCLSYEIARAWRSPPTSWSGSSGTPSRDTWRASARTRRSAASSPWSGRTSTTSRRCTTTRCRPPHRACPRRDCRPSTSGPAGAGRSPR